MQHRKLVELLNLLINHLALQSDAPVLFAIFEELKAYVADHFRTEEAVWHQYFQDDCWELEHRRCHGDFIAEVLRIKTAEAHRPLGDVIAEIVSFLTHWLAYHILENDKRLSKAVLEMQSGKSLEVAKQLAIEEMSGATKVLIDTLMGMSDLLAHRTVELTREIIRRQEAEKELALANEAKRAFLANMSHEIRTPLSAITGMVYMLLRDGVTEKQSVQLGKIDRAGKHLLSVINDILDLSKIEAGKFSLEENELFVGSLVENVASMLAEKVRERNLRLVVENEFLPYPVLGDGTRIQQALLNYASNAVKFTEKGHIILRVEKLGESDDFVVLRFEVQDTGIGLEPEACARLFNPYEQGNTATSRKYGGTGLGLAITRRISELMGGEVGVESVLGRGSRFWFTARLKKGVSVFSETEREPRQNAPELILSVVGRGRRVLVVEDNEINLEITRMLVEDVGLEVDSAVNGEQAVGLVLLNDYALVLMDMQMPVMDGLEATRRIREMSKRQMPIVAMTANAFIEDKHRCLEAGMDDFLSKPVDPENLYGLMLKYLQHEG